MDSIELTDTRRENLRKLIDNQFQGVTRRFCLATSESESYVQRLLSEPGSRFHKRMGGLIARRIEATVKLPAGWLDIRFGEGVNETLRRMRYAISLSKDTPETLAVPVIGWNNIPSLMEAGVENVEDWVWCPVHHGPRTFALDANRGGDYGVPRNYRKGSLFFIDMDQPPEEDRRVVAVTNGIPVFRSYEDHSGKARLIDVYDNHRPLTRNFKVVGTVLGMWLAE